MKAIIPNIDERSKRAYYLQLYDYIKEAILSGEIRAGEKLPSLRSLSRSLGLSMTTVELAYSQLTVEGYIYSKPQSGYYAGNVLPTETITPLKKQDVSPLDRTMEAQEPEFYYDLDCFDFNKWKKCVNKVITEYSPLLFFESDPQGEMALRYEISKYLYQSRGVICDPTQIVIGAGTQQITNHLANILKKMAVDHVAVEDPGYMPVNNIFRDRGFSITPVKVGKEGITIDRLPSNIRSAVYVSPSNQVPTGAVMPIGKRYELLEWAIKNDSIIMEDDYDSELRYFGKPIPALQGLDTKERVVYLGSFSTTLFSSIKISYMVLPPAMAEIFRTIRGDYTQTCSKMEQLTLALFMEKGFYQTNIKKLRNLYSQKLHAVVKCLSTNFTKPTNTSSGINIIVRVKGTKSAQQLCADAKALGIAAIPTAAYTGETEDNSTSLILYYNQIPLADIPDAMKELVQKWRSADAK
ncbi:PLP-dependent aminotransferase family protein [Anaerovorax odorimutans]|uniref:PLP-dependent aminotransferase family protein n=1 Tax=Anaerovorax odorimutans TaxID=109327 RepID=A0ABT1RPG5_9FIRM|nr:PLP-dependent aminotransferase family protein [Anaerovorax odorimutans]MCQ4636776.1 PLP-dependent aminotransferase family protein [Anaerovorax odorimutans]